MPTSRAYDDAHDGRRAAELVENAAARVAFGWVQGVETATLDGGPAFQTEEAWRFCILGALESAARAMSLAHEGDLYRHSVDAAHQRALQAVAAATNAGDVPGDAAPWSISGYNDAPERTKDEVLAALERAAERLRSPALAD